MRHPFRHLATFALLAALAAPAWAGKPVPLGVSPSSSKVAAGAQVALKASGGAGGYTYALTTDASGGQVDATTGVYTAGATSGTDTITVTDSAGATATAQVQVAAAAGAADGTTDGLGGHR